MRGCPSLRDGVEEFRIDGMKIDSYFLLLTLFIAMIVTQSAVMASAAYDNNIWGGIALSAKTPPPGTAINDNLSLYYGKPTATGDNKVYWHIGGYGWFNQTEMLNLPSVSLIYDISPYDCESYGCGRSSDTKSIIEASVSGIVIVGFIGISVMLWRKHAPN